MSHSQETPLATIERLVAATNAHDLEGIVSLFAEDYTLDAPTHPQRAFRGTEQVRRNWTQIFAGVPNIATRLVRSAVEGDSVWSEWEMSGTRRDGSGHRMSGVFIFGVSAGKIHWGRMFLEPVDESGADINAALRGQIAPR